MSKIFLILSPIALLVLGLQQPKPAPQTWSVPPEIARMANPAKPTPESKALARKMYGYDCATCHAANGNGNGELAANLRVKPKNWTVPGTLGNMTDGELFYIIKNGKDTMPAEGGRMNDDGLWNMVILVRAYESK
jgi:mono/diheme cytochrome c family protein